MFKFDIIITIRLALDKRMGNSYEDIWRDQDRGRMVVGNKSKYKLPTEVTNLLLRWHLNQEKKDTRKKWDKQI